MPLFERYVLRRTTHAFLLTLGTLTATLWITQVLRELDVVTAKGQAIWVFLVITVLALPAILQLIAPIAFLVAAIAILNRLTNDSELPVIAGAGASRKAVHRPILVLALSVMLAVMLSHHILAPASLATLRTLLTRVQTTMIAMLVQEGGFRSVQDGLTMHIREKAADGSFRGVFIDDERDPNESLQYTAAEGVLLEQAGGSFLVLQNGDLIREERNKREHTVVAFETYALDLSQIGSPAASDNYKAKERSTSYLLNPPPGDESLTRNPEHTAGEIHDRMTAPLYTLGFALIALAFLGRPRTNRQDRSLAIAAVVLLCLLLRAGGFAAVQAARASSTAVPLMYLIPLGGIAFGIYAILRETRPRLPRPIEAGAEALLRSVLRLARRAMPQARMAAADQS